jgi:ribonuclease E
MTKRMLIDASHPEETRVVVVDGTRLEEFDFESSTKERLKGNIYLAKVTRVEPSLQAAFVDYGRERHGFLAFSEIHPDYSQIPIGDRQELPTAEASDNEDEEINADADSASSETENGADNVELVGGDEIDEISRRSPPTSRRYKIQEVIKRRQIMLIQVAKDERGSKGAALTTFLSLAGRYCVLMPNTARDGGISRKIVDADDRRRLKTVLSGLPVTDDMGVILRTAGMNRTKSEIRRDFDFLVRQWETIRELTLNSTAPTMIHEEGNLIKRTIRDLYSKDVEQILIEGETGYRIGKSFMRAMIPSHAKRVQKYDDKIPLFQRYQVIDQLDAMHSPVAQLKSGGSIVISPTEALVAIDVNSGRATKERNIEETATKTNIEAAAEIARQLRLRDLAGLIVIDFIDMEEPKNLRLVERRFKEAVKSDRARIQIGRITAFGLLELSRQRLRPSLLEASSQLCPHCGGSGHVRSTESTALHVLRLIEEEAIRARSSELTVFAPTEVALYLLNEKRQALREIEEPDGLQVRVRCDDTLVPPDCRLERSKTHGLADTAVAPTDESSMSVIEKDKGQRKRRRRRAKPTDSVTTIQDENAKTVVAAGTESEVASPEAGDESRKRRRRGKRGGRRRGRGAMASADRTPETTALSSNDSQATNDLPSEAATEDAATESPVEIIDPPATAKKMDGPTRVPRRRRTTPEAKTKQRKPAAKKPSRRKKSASNKTSPSVASAVGDPAVDNSVLEQKASVPETANPPVETIPTSPPIPEQVSESATLSPLDAEASHGEKKKPPRRSRQSKGTARAKRAQRTGSKPKNDISSQSERGESKTSSKPGGVPIESIGDIASTEPQAPLARIAAENPAKNSEESNVVKSQRAPRRGWWQRLSE